MKDLSMHILDIVENATRAGAKNVCVELVEDTRAGTLVLTITDDGRGMSDNMRERVTDPFFTTRTERPVGLGLPLLKMNAELCGGRLDIESQPGAGTRITAKLMLNHIDCLPLGDVNETLRVMIAGNPQVDFHVRFVSDGTEEQFSTRPEAPGFASIPLKFVP